MSRALRFILRNAARSIRLRVAGMQRAVQRDHVRLREHLIVRREGHALHLRRRMIGEQHAHAEGAPDRRGALADGAFADDAERRAVQIADVVREEAELLGLVPDAVLRRPAGRRAGCGAAPGSSRRRVRARCAPRSCGCWRRRCRAPCNRRRRRHRSRSPPRRSSSARGSCSRVVRAHRHLVDDGDGRAREPRHDLLGGGLLVLDVFGRHTRACAPSP